MYPDFEIETSRTADSETIRVAGELDSATAPDLAEHFHRAIDDGLAEVRLDLRDLSCIDSAGMRAVILVERIAAERGVRLLVTPPPPPLTDLLRVAGVADRLALAQAAADEPPGGPLLEQIEIRLPRDQRAPGRARAEVREAIRGAFSDTDCATSLLLTSELVTNAVVHPPHREDDSVSLRIRTYEDRVRVEVTDSGHGFDPGSVPVAGVSEGGRGLIVVDSLASRWGTGRASEGAGFVVWFELAPQQRPQLAASGV